ncbi:VOC family protein [Bauldia sp.]|uniref:VOC family protein n=1 Tax=Bauldia sp. TaxID=2575872 RepID=UPI003BA99458
MTEKPNMNQLMNGVIPYLGIERAGEAIAFYEKAFGAIRLGDVMRDEQGQIMNASLAINDGVFMLMDYMTDLGDPPAKTGQNFTLTLVVDDGDMWWSRAVDAGCEVTMPFEKQFWGDRYGRLRDPFGLDWAVDEPSAENRAAAG